MKMIKILFLIIIILLVSSCKTQYRIQIREDLSIEEALFFYERNEIIKNYHYSIDTFINTNVAEFRLHGYLDKKHIVEKDIGKNESGVIVKKEYDDFNVFAKEGELKELFSDINMIRNNNIITIELITNEDKISLFKGDYEAAAILAEMEIIITVPYLILNHNADNYDLGTNTYFWHYDENAADKRVEITFDIDKKIAVSFADRISLANKKVFLNPYIIIPGIIIIMGVVGFLIHIKNRENNTL